MRVLLLWQRTSFPEETKHLIRPQVKALDSQQQQQREDETVSPMLPISLMFECKNNAKLKPVPRRTPSHGIVRIVQITKTMLPWHTHVSQQTNEEFLLHFKYTGIVCILSTSYNIKLQVYIRLVTMSSITVANKSVD